MSMESFWIYHVEFGRKKNCIYFYLIKLNNIIWLGRKCVNNARCVTKKD